MTTRKQSRIPKIPPDTLRKDTVRKGQDGEWWTVTSDGWERLYKHKFRTRKTRKIKGALRNLAETIGQITVFYNKEESCDQANKPECIIPSYTIRNTNFSEDNWSLQYSEGIPDSPTAKYMCKDIYSGGLNKMDMVQQQLLQHYTKYKNKHMISEFKIIAESMKQYYKRTGAW